MTEYTAFMEISHTQLQSYLKRDVKKNNNLVLSCVNYYLRSYRFKYTYRKVYFGHEII